MRRPSPFRRKLSAFCLLALVVAGCNNTDDTSAPSGPPQGGFLRIGQVGTTGSLNPYVGGAFDVYANIFPFLIQFNLNTVEIEPYFAASWKTADDGRTWTFKTRPNAKWSDGQPMTARDAAFTLNMTSHFKAGPTSNYASYVNFLERAEATDDETVVLHYDRPVGAVLPQAGWVRILPEHVWGPLATGDGQAIKRFENMPSEGQPVVSGGPWMLTRYEKDEVAIFERNPHYFGPRPALDGFGVRYFADKDALVTALKVGEIDAIDGVPPPAAEGLKSAGFVVESAPGIDYHALDINPNPAKTNNREILNPVVRRAFEHAIDRQQVAQVVFLGYASPGAANIPPANGFWHNPRVGPLPFNPDEGNRLLDQLGFARGPDGVRVADGEPMSYEVLMQPADNREFEILRSGFERIGVKLTARSLDRAALSQAQRAPDGKYLEYDFALSSGTSGGFDPDFGLSTFTCEALGVINSTGYCNPAYDELYNQQESAAQTERVPIVHRMQEMLYEARAKVVIAYVDQIDAWSKDWAGFAESPRGMFSTLSPQTLTSVHRVAKKAQ